MSRTTLTLEQRIEAAPAAVFHAFTNSTALREWLCDAAMVVPRKDGRLHLWWSSGYHATGDFTKVVPGERISFTWQGKGEPAPTRVRVALRPDDEGTVVELVHKGIGGGKKWAGAAAAIQRGWETGLENLRSVLETGHDLRFTRRPMLGILPDALTSEAAARLGVPIDKGILLGGVVEGMGAAAAGLQQGDVIVRIGKGKTRDGAGLQNALQGHRAGDEVEVVYYRGAEKAKATMTLSARALDEPPATAAALAEAVSAAGEDFLGRLAAAFEGIDDERAGRRPGEGQWSAREVLCHLIPPSATPTTTSPSWSAAPSTGSTSGPATSISPTPDCSPSSPPRAGCSRSYGATGPRPGPSSPPCPTSSSPVGAPTGGWLTGSSRAASTTTGTWPRSRRRWRRSRATRHAPVRGRRPRSDRPSNLP